MTHNSSKARIKFIDFPIEMQRIIKKCWVVNGNITILKV